jgi:hypothetical protein
MGRPVPRLREQKLFPPVVLAKGTPPAGAAGPGADDGQPADPPASVEFQLSQHPFHGLHLVVGNRRKAEGGVDEPGGVGPVVVTEGLELSGTVRIAFITSTATCTKVITGIHPIEAGTSAASMSYPAGARVALHSRQTSGEPIAVSAPTRTSAAVSGSSTQAPRRPSPSPA